MAATMTEQLLSQSKSLVKQYIEFDGASRPSKVYTAPTSAINGTPCTVTEYIYTSPTSTLVKARKEAHSTWQIAWDVDFTVSE
jgi:hypothetical protein